MTPHHDPFRQLNYLQQCLSNDKRPLGLLLGAGCPVSVKNETGEPLIPHISGMTELVRQRLAACASSQPLLHTLDRHFVTDGCPDANIEKMLSHIRGLRLVAGKGNVRGFTADDLDQLDNQICRMVHELADRSLPDHRTPYHHAARWSGAVGRDHPVQLFTTNYDLLLEQALEDSRVPYFDGFAGARRPFFDIRAMEEDRLPPRWARLWKLHGSINWYQDPSRGVIRGAPNESEFRRVIHPSHLKYEESRRMPYLAMMDRLSAFLKQPSAVLVVSGYSFGDDHINEVIVQGLQATPTAAVFGLLFGELTNYAEAVRLAEQRANLTILAMDAGGVGGRTSTWIEAESDALLQEGDEWVDWTAPDADGKVKAVLKLGDFAVLGSFLLALLGSPATPEESPNGA